MARVLSLCACLVALATLAGCASPAPLDDAEAARAGVACDAGQAVTGFNATGVPACGTPSVADFECPAGQFVNGFTDGKPHCAAPGEPAPTTPPTPTPTYEAGSNLKVLNVYGVRGNATDASLWDCEVNTELSAGAVPMDLSKLIVRYADGNETRTYTHGAAALATAQGPSATFNATWIRGDGGATFVMQPGDLVQIHVNGCSVAPRTSVSLQLIPETGSPVSADFKTPATYGTDTTITLR
jgi:hypothetical protein